MCNMDVDLTVEREKRENYTIALETMSYCMRRCIVIMFERRKMFAGQFQRLRKT